MVHGLEVPRGLAVRLEGEDRAALVHDIYLPSLLRDEAVRADHRHCRHGGERHKRGGRHYGGRPQGGLYAPPEFYYIVHIIVVCIVRLRPLPRWPPQRRLPC